MSLSKGMLEKIILKTKESSLQTKARNYVNSQEGMFWIKFNDRYTSGIPDALIIVSSSSNVGGNTWHIPPKYIWVEFKSRTGKAKKIQDYFRNKLISTGSTVHLIKSMEKLKEILE